MRNLSPNGKLLITWITIKMLDLSLFYPAEKTLNSPPKSKMVSTIVQINNSFYAVFVAGDWCDLGR